MHKSIKIGIGVIKAMLAIIASIIIIRLCFFDIFRIPGASMQNALKHRDHIIINKTFYGGIFSGLLPGNKQPAPNDLFVFKNNHQYVVKRCIALPGTAVEIINDIVLVNGRPVQEPLTIRHYYKIWFNNYTSLNKALDECQINIFKDHFKKYATCIAAYLDNSEKSNMLKKQGIDSITLFSINNELPPDTPDSLYEIQNLQPLVLPYRGMTIKADTATVNAYANILTSCEGIKLEQRGSYFLFNGIPVQQYVFKNDYYFFMGDNRDNSFDSRYFGPIPGKRLTGKVIARF